MSKDDLIDKVDAKLKKKVKKKISRSLIAIAERSVKEELQKDVKWMPFNVLIKKILTQTPLKAQMADNEKLIDLYEELLNRYGKAPSMQAIMVTALAEKAMLGDVSAFKEVVDRIEGKALQKTENKNMNVSYLDYLKELERGKVVDPVEHNPDFIEEDDYEES